MTAREQVEWGGLSLAALAALWEAPLVEAYDRIGSTSERALELARAGALPGTVVVANQQTAGRGRRGATWESPARSGLWMSVLLSRRHYSIHLPLLVGLACAEGIEAYVPRVHVDIKWPNDLLVGRLKLGGVLCESEGESVVVGIGINVRTPLGGFSDALAGVATSLEMVNGKELSRTELGAHILDRLRQVLRREAPFRAAFAELERRDALAGHRVRTEHQGVGLAVGIDPSGALVLERRDGTRVQVTSGSVSFETPG